VLDTGQVETVYNFRVADYRNLLESCGKFS